MVGEAENLAQLRNRIKYCLDKFEPDLVHRLTRGTNTQLNAVQRLGVIEKRWLLIIKEK